jgi:hypothetical protein
MATIKVAATALAVRRLLIIFRVLHSRMCAFRRELRWRTDGRHVPADGLIMTGVPTGSVMRSSVSRRAHGFEVDVDRRDCCRPSSARRCAETSQHRIHLSLQIRPQSDHLDPCRLSLRSRPQWPPATGSLPAAVANACSRPPTMPPQPKGVLPGAVHRVDEKLPGSFPLLAEQEHQAWQAHPGLFCSACS